MAILDIVYSAREIAQVNPPIATRMNSLTDLNSTEYRSVQYAVKCYSNINPRTLSASFDATGNFDYDISLIIPGWKKSTHRIKDIVFPGNDISFYNYGYLPQNYMDKQDWTTFNNPFDGNKQYLRFLNGQAPPASSSRKIFILYTCPHVVDADNDTITDEEDGDVEAFAYLVASRILTVASNWYARLDDPSLEMQVVDNGNKSNVYTQRSKDAYKVFDEHMKWKVEHSGRIDWDFYSSEGDERFWNDSRLM